MNINDIQRAIQYLKEAKINNSKELITYAIDYINKTIENIENENSNIIDNLSKTYEIDCYDSNYEYSGIKIALDDVVNMEVGDDLGMVAHLLPHTYARTNPFKLTTSNKNVVDIDGMVMTAKSSGCATITATTLNGKYSDSILINVTEVSEFEPTQEETYIIEPERFKLIADDMSQEQAWINSNAIKSIILYAHNKGYKKIVFPKKQIYYYDPGNTIYFKNNIIMDLNGSTIQAYPNYLYTYTGIYMRENKRMVNVCPRGWIGLEDTGYVSYITDYSPDERGVMRYWTQELSGDYIYDLQLTTGGELGEYYVDGQIPIVDSYSIDDYNQYEDSIIKGEEYIGYFKFFKRRTYKYNDKNYTNKDIKLVAEYYKNDILVESEDLVKIFWTKWISLKEVEFKLTIDINKDYDYVKLKAMGLSDNTYPVYGTLYDVKLYRKHDVNDLAENIIIENGNILGDRFIQNEDGEYIKEKLFNEAYGKSWSSIQCTEGTLNLSIENGYNIGCRNMTIGDSIGFNIGIGNGTNLNSYYPNANLFEYGAFDSNGNKIDKDLYCRLSTPVSVNIGNSPYFIICDPTFATTYYYGFRSRLVDIYCYDENMNLLKSFEGKFRHGVLKAPEGTKYMNISVPLIEGELLPIKGNSDFSNCITAIKFIHPMIKGFIKDCEIKGNYSCGIAHSGVSITIDNCNFYNNIGRMPWCDIDSEDGWVRMQNNVFRNNTFNSYYGVIMCSGTNYVFKNNTFNCPFIEYADTQYFKIINNTFNNAGYIGASGLGTMADSYITKNNFNNITVSPNTAHGKEYKVYLVDNKLIDCRIGISDSKTVCVNNELIGDSYMLNNNNNVFYGISNRTNKITIVNTCEINDIDFKNIIIEVDSNKTVIFNNCTLKRFPTNISGKSMGKCVFNNCTLVNAKESSNYTYNNCEFANGIIDDYILDGIDRDKLVFTQKDANGIYYGMQDTNIKKAKDWTICALMKKINNYNCMLILCDACEIFPASGKNSVNTYIHYTKDGGTTKESWRWSTTSPTDLVGDSDYFTSTITYDSTAKKYAIYLNNVLVRDRAIPDGYEPYPITNPIKIEQSQCSIIYYYAYDKCLNEEERTNVYNVLSNEISNL